MTLHDFSHHGRSKLPTILGAVGLGFLTSSLMLASPVSASVLVKPVVLQEEGASPLPDTPVAVENRQNIVGVASATAGFSTLVAAIESANIGSVLSAEGPLTVFAPTDAAFAMLPAGTLEALLLSDNRDLLVRLLYNHVAYGDLTSDQLSVGLIDTFDGNVAVAFTPTGVEVNNANVLQADIDASNGVIHSVDQVLLPAGFARQLQARIDGVESASVVEESPEATGAAPTATEATDAQPDEPSTSAVEAEPVRALW